MLDRMFMGAAADDKLFVEDVFSTYLYTGNGSSQTITNGIDLAGKGGLVWIKKRSASESHFLVNSASPGFRLETDGTGAQGSQSVLSLTSSGFSLLSGNAAVNGSGSTYASWTFREAPKFFDVVTYTGDGTNSNRRIPHNLGSEPGCIIVKRTDSTSDWVVYHRSLPATTTSRFLMLNSTSEYDTSGGIWGTSDPTSTDFGVGSSSAKQNISDGTYVAYLFAHDATSDGIIQCGSYTGNGTANSLIATLGFEPQWLLVKRTDTTSDWIVVDVMRGAVAGGDVQNIYPNWSAAEVEVGSVAPGATGIMSGNTAAWGESNASGGNYIYVAIRRGPMRTPTLGTSVFAPITQSSGTNPRDIDVGINPDLMIAAVRSGANTTASDRLRGNALLVVNLTAADTTGTTQTIVGRANNLVRISSANISGFATSNSVFWNFRRAPSFMDVVVYTGTGVAGRTVNHNLGVAPELMIVKSRNANEWRVYNSTVGAGAWLVLNTPDASVSGNITWNTTAPTASVFTVGNSSTVNSSGPSYVAYLFASCPGVSKVGSYTGTGESDGSPASAQTINCGFSNGARFVLIKATSDSGDWYVFDTARGITTTASPWLWLNSTSAEQSGTGYFNYVEPHATGFTLAHDEGYINACNYKDRNYIFLAIA